LDERSSTSSENVCYLLADDSPPCHVQLKAPRLIIHPLQFVLVQQPRSLERRNEGDPIGPDFTNFTYFKVRPNQLSSCTHA
jgi:hypothetical protein